MTTTTLTAAQSGDHDDAGYSLAYAAAAGPRERDFLIQIGSEIEYVEWRGNQFARPWQVIRGYLGTAVADHAQGATVTVEPAIGGGVGSGGGVSVTDGTTTVAATSIQTPAGTLTDLGSGLASVVAVLSDHGAPVAGENELQQVLYEDSFPITGTFRLTFGGDETTNIDVQATLIEDIIAALEALPSIGAGNIEANGGTGETFVSNGGELDVRFIGDLGVQNVSSLSVTTVNMVHNATPVTDASGFSVSGTDGQAGVPAVAGAATLYLDLDTGDLYANTGDELTPAWTRIGPLGLAGVIAVSGNASASSASLLELIVPTVVGGAFDVDFSGPGALGLGSPTTDTGGSASLLGGVSAGAHTAIGGIVTAAGAVGTTGGLVSIRGGSSAGNDGAGILLKGATDIADGGMVVTGLPTSDPGVAGQLYSNGVPSAGVPKALMVSGG